MMLIGALFAEHRPPGEDADQERGPERDDAEDEEDASAASCS